MLSAGDFVVDRLCTAASLIGEQYFVLPVAGRLQGVARERLYCYELYHQLRNELGDNFEYAVGGEIDKSGHPLMQGRGISHSKPDLLIHRPGDMNGNLVVIEVKALPVRFSGLKKDLATLSAYLNAPANYQRAIYLVYGSSQSALDALLGQCRQAQEEGEFRRTDLEQVELYWHQHVQEQPRRVPWSFSHVEDAEIGADN